MIQFKFDAKDLKEFQDALVHGEEIAARGLWRGTGASLGALRREFLRTTRVHIGKQPKYEYRGANPNPKSKTYQGIRFRWDRFPKKEKDVKNTSQIKGSFFTTSEAAEGLEIGATASPKKGGKWLFIPMLKEGRDNTAVKRKDVGHLQPKRNWKTFERFLEGTPAKKYEWEMESKGSYRIIYARKKFKQKKKNLASQWFPAFLMKRSIKLPARLGLYDFYQQFIPEIEFRFKRELTEIVSNIIKRSKRGRRRR